jgi:hypothetical protein
MNQPYKITGTLTNKHEVPSKKEGGKAATGFDLEAVFEIKPNTCETRILPFKTWGYTAKDVDRINEGSIVELTLLPKGFNDYLNVEVSRISLIQAGHAPEAPSNGLDFDPKPAVAELVASVADDEIPF